jgi:hypothetical protein
MWVVCLRTAPFCAVIVVGMSSFAGFRRVLLPRRVLATVLPQRFAVAASTASGPSGNRSSKLDIGASGTLSKRL